MFFVFMYWYFKTELTCSISLHSWLLQAGKSQTKINQLLYRNDEEECDIGNSLEDCDVETLPHNDEKTWLLLDCSRAEAENLLAGKPDGTFFIRRARAKPNHALSIACGGTTKHCIIASGNRGMGFAEPYNIYPTLKHLVLHYATNSLEIHNDNLKTTLAYPLFARNNEYVCAVNNSLYNNPT